MKKYMVLTSQELVARSYTATDLYNDFESAVAHINRKLDKEDRHIIKLPIKEQPLMISLDESIIELWICDKKSPDDMNKITV